MIVPAGPHKGAICYPETDGLPMSENTRQFRWIVTLAGNLAALFRDRDDVFVCGNQFWYPVEGEPETRMAPDVYVVFGRPKGDRPSYRQWEEGGVPMTVVFETISPGNTGEELIDKLEFYEEYGAEECYLYNPETNRLRGYERKGDVLRRVRRMNGFVSPRLGIRFDLSGPELVVRYPDGRTFLIFEELEAERARTEQRAEQAEQRAEQAEQRAEQESARAEQAERRAARTAELGLKVLRQEATPEDVAELQRLLQASPPESA
jgi:Uma2 family endonuclease